MEFEGIVIRRVPYKGDDVMINVLTKNKIEAFLAKGVLKLSSKNAASTNLFSKSKFQIFKGKEGHFLRVGELIESYPNINNDLDKLGLLDFVSEITNNLLENRDATNVYEYLEKTLMCLNANFSPWTATLIYFAHILNVSGYGFQVNCCQNCGKTSEICAISLTDGGFICKDCFDESKHLKLNPRLLKIIKYIFMVDLNNFERIEFEKDECKELLLKLMDFLSWVGHFNLKSRKLIENL